MMHLDRLVKQVTGMPVVRSVWRIGYGKRGAIHGFGWRRVCWRFWWLDVRLERELLEAYAANWNVRVIDGESNSALRERLKYMVKTAWSSRARVEWESSR